MTNLIENKGLVSLIVPCYNMGHVIHRLLNSILSQTYKKLEIIIVDDGSTDNSKSVIESFRSKFEDQGIKLLYVYQSNQGLGGAINTGLKYFTGEYLCWPDADDYLSNDSVEIRKQFLDDNPDYAIVRSDAYVFNETDLLNPIGYISRKKPNRFRENLFDDYITENDVIFCPGCHMIRSSVLLEVNPERSIFPARRGQNYQMLLPIIYSHKFAFIDKPLYNYIIYSNSMSRGDDTFEKCIVRQEGLKEIVLETLKKIPMRQEIRGYYEYLLNIKLYGRLCISAYNLNNKKEFAHYYSLLQKHGELTYIHKLARLLIYVPFMKPFAKIVKRLIKA